MNRFWLTIILCALSVGTLFFVGLKVSGDNSDQDRRDRVAQQQRAEQDWVTTIKGCFRARARTKNYNSLARSHRRFLYFAAQARFAAYRRDGNQIDYDTAKFYLSEIPKSKISTLTNCRDSYPPPPGVSWDVLELKST